MAVKVEVKSAAPAPAPKQFSFAEMKKRPGAYATLGNPDQLKIIVLSDTVALYVNDPLTIIEIADCSWIGPFVKYEHPVTITLTP